ncbi:MAG: hypothetical protein ABRQ39_20680 [Candidatus Eremiobacterota bacterium]
MYRKYVEMGFTAEPFMIVHGQIIRNPYYLHPDEYIRNITG